MKSILVTGSTFPRYMEDTEPKFVYDLCKEYAKKYKVTALVPAAPGALEHEMMEGIEVIRYHYFPIHKWETLCYPGAIVPRIKEKKVRALLVPFLFVSLFFNLKKYQKNYDHVHCNWIIPQGIIHGLFKKKYIVSGLGGDVTSLNFWPINKLKNKCVRKASYMTVVSEDLKKAAEELYGRKDIRVIPMGCSLEEFSPANKVANCFGETNKKVILFVGRLCEKKGCTYLIDAMKKIDAKLVIVGGGPLEKELKEQAAATGADIEFVGPKTKKELAPMYASCDFFCLPSVIAADGDKDGLPVALVEAMASGATAVGSNLAGLAEIIKDRENGRLVVPDSSESIVQVFTELLADEELCKKYSLEARKTAEKYDFTEIANEYIEMFESIDHNA